MWKRRLSAVTLGVSDLARSLRFYQAMGFQAKVALDDVAFIQLAGLVLCLYGDLARDGGVEGQGRGPGLIALAHNVRDKDGVDDVLAEAFDAGGRITRPAHDAEWGGRSGYFTDPDGHLWEVAWNPQWPIDEEGRVRIGG